MRGSSTCASIRGMAADFAKGPKASESGGAFWRGTRRGRMGVAEPLARALRGEEGALWLGVPAVDAGRLAFGKLRFGVDGFDRLPASAVGIADAS